MKYLNKFRKYKTFFMLKYANIPNLNLNDQKLELEFSAYELSTALLDYGYNFKDLKIETLRNKTRGESNPSLLKEYCESMRIARHNLLVEIIALETNAIFYGSYKEFKTALNRESYCIQATDTISVNMKLLPDGRIKLIKIIDNEVEIDRDYVFYSLNEFYLFANNLVENIEIDDKVLDMALI